MTMIANGIWIIRPSRHRHVAVVSPLQIRRVRSNQYEGITVLWLFRARKAPLHWDRMTWLQQPMTFVQGFVVYLVLAREHSLKPGRHPPWLTTITSHSNAALKHFGAAFEQIRLLYTLQPLHAALHPLLVFTVSRQRIQVVVSSPNHKPTSVI